MTLTAMPLPPLRDGEHVEHVVATYLTYVDQETPGSVEGLYLTGSTALGEFRPGTSDIDFVAVMSSKSEATTLAGLARAHERLRADIRRPYFDGVYVTWNELARDPREAQPGPYSYEGRFNPNGPINCGPVAWHTVARHGLRCRGPEPTSLGIWADPDALHSWTLKNLDDYWHPLLRRARRVTDPWSLIAFSSYGAAWIVLGLCRLHYTLATGAITSKEDAGKYGLTAFPKRWHRVLAEAIRIRRADRARADFPSAAAELFNDFRRPAAGGSLFRTPLARRNDVLAFGEMVIADAGGARGSSRSHEDREGNNLRDLRSS